MILVWCLTNPRVKPAMRALRTLRPHTVLGMNLPTMPMLPAHPGFRDSVDDTLEPTFSCWIGSRMTSERSQNWTKWKRYSKSVSTTPQKDSGYQAKMLSRSYFKRSPPWPAKRTAKTDCWSYIMVVMVIISRMAALG